MNSPLISKLDELQKICRAATPGDWDARDEDINGEEYWFSEYVVKVGPAVVGGGDTELIPRYKADATHIATFSPPTVMKMIETIRELREAIQKIDDPMKHHHWEEDAYTRAGCFQFVAQEALKKVEELWK